MKIINRFFQLFRPNKRRRKSFDLGGGFFIGGVGVNGIEAFTGWAYAAISMRAKRVGAISLHLYELVGDGVDEVMDDEILNLLYQPNRSQSMYEFFYTLEMFLCLWGSAPIYKERKNNRIIAIWPLRPDMLTSYKDVNGNIVKYTYRVDGKSKDYPAADVFEILQPSPVSLTDGFAPIDSVLLDIQSDLAAAIWNKSILENGSDAGVVLETENELTDEQFARIQKTWNSRQAGPYNAGKTAILEAGLKANSIGKSPKDMALLDIRKFNRSAIVSILGVPEPLLTSENSNLANIEGSERVFATNTINPEMRLIIDSINEFLIAEIDDNKYLGYDSPIKADAQEKINMATAGEGRWMTVNEARELFDLPPLINGDDVYKPFGVTPTVGGEKSMKLLKVNKKQMTPYQNEIKRRILARTSLKRAIINRIAASVEKRLKEGQSKTIKCSIVEVKDLDEEGADLHPTVLEERKEYLKALPKYEKKYRDALNKFFRDLEKETLENFNDNPPPKSGVKANVPWVSKIIFDKLTAEEVLIEMSGDFWKENIKRGSDSVARMLGVDPLTGFTTPFVINFIQEREFKIKNVVDTTISELRDTLVAGVTAGESTSQIRQRIEDVFNMAQSVRSETIARTEVSSAQNFGRLEEMKQNKIEKKKWIAIFSNTREEHEAAHGQVVLVDEAFDVGGELLQFPGDPDGSAWNVINCQCSASPTLEDLTQAS